MILLIINSLTFLCQPTAYNNLHLLLPCVAMFPSFHSKILYSVPTILFQTLEINILPRKYSFSVLIVVLVIETTYHVYCT